MKTLVGAIDCKMEQKGICCIENVI